jgi:hypothetical protein
LRSQQCRNDGPPICELCLAPLACVLAQAVRRLGFLGTELAKATAGSIDAFWPFLIDPSGAKAMAAAMAQTVK